MKSSVTFGNIRRNFEQLVQLLVKFHFRQQVNEEISLQTSSKILCRFQLPISSPEVIAIMQPPIPYSPFPCLHYFSIALAITVLFLQMFHLQYKL